MFKITIAKLCLKFDIWILKFICNLFIVFLVLKINYLLFIKRGLLSPYFLHEIADVGKGDFILDKILNGFFFLCFVGIKVV